MNRLLILFAITSTTLSACTSSFRNITIETAIPSSHKISSEVGSFTLIDRATTADFNAYDKQKTQQYFFDHKFNTSVVVLDSLATDTTLKALGQLLYESGAYDVVIPEGRFYAHENKYYEIPNPLSAEEIKRLCRDYNTDAVLSLDRYYNKIFTDYTTYDDEYAVASIRSAYNIVVSIYTPTDKGTGHQVVVSDTISWQQGGTSTQDIFLKLPPITDCLIQTGIQSALDLDAKISPQWKRENRIFFTLDPDDSDGKKAIQKTNQQEWTDLYAYWLNFEKSKKASTRSRAQFNLALASEMLGNMDESLIWIKKSLQTKYTQQGKYYLDTLLQRQKSLN
ncbi:MAG: DUF6340 family protein [Mangrovibacterium sp.]